MNMPRPNLLLGTRQWAAMSKQSPEERTRARERAIVDLLRKMVLSREPVEEHFHAVFVDDKREYLGDAPLGRGGKGHLSLRMRDLFGCALSIGADGIVIAHNHPSGLCRPSRYDIEATAKLRTVAEALDIKLLDHLIFTQSAVYSMRAGGKL